MKIYLNHTTTERGTSATEAMSWHRNGDTVQVLTYDENGAELADVMIQDEKELTGEKQVNKTLKLRKCAYIFDSTHGTFFYGTREQHAKRHAAQKALQEYYYNEEKRTEEIPYTTDGSGNPVINLNGENHRLNALQIASINGDPDNVINHRRQISAAAIGEKTSLFHVFCRDSLYSNKFKTLQFEFFTGPEELGYIRVHFNRNHEQFIIDDRTGELFTSGEYGPHKPTTADAIRERLEITSAAAKKEFNEIISIITEG